MTITATATAARAGGPPGYSGRKADHLARLARIEGQVCGVTCMVGEDRYCTGVLNQIIAITRALREVALGLLDDHPWWCVTGAARSYRDEGEEKLAEPSVVLRRLLPA